MAKSPFREREAPAKIANETKSPMANGPVSPLAGKAIVHSRQTGDPLPPAGEDAVDHEPLIPWPQPASGVDHKPFKSMK